MAQIDAVPIAQKSVSSARPIYPSHDETLTNQVSKHYMASHSGDRMPETDTYTNRQSLPDNSSNHHARQRSGGTAI